MLKTFFKVVFVGAFVASFSLAEDFLAKVSKGALSDNSAGVKKLSEAEMAEVKGGYRIGSVNWYVYTYKTMPYRNNYNANRRPQTTKQPIYSNAWCKYYGCLSGRY